MEVSYIKDRLALRKMLSNKFNVFKNLVPAS